MIAFEIMHNGCSRADEYARSAGDAAENFAREVIHKEGNARVEVRQKGTDRWQVFNVRVAYAKTVAAFEMESE